MFKVGDTIHFKTPVGIIYGSVRAPIGLDSHNEYRVELFRECANLLKTIYYYTDVVLHDSGYLTLVHDHVTYPERRVFKVSKGR